MASFLAAAIGILAMTFFSPLIAAIALEFGAVEYFSMMLLGLVAASTISIGSPAKGVAMVVLGMALGCIGTDVNTGMPRFALGMTELFDGIGLAALAIGLIASINDDSRKNSAVNSVALRALSMYHLLAPPN